jgi:hypothetical protein
MAGGDNRVSALFDLGRNFKMLEWKPRLIALLIVLVLVTAALAAGYFDLVLDNWEW